MGFVLALSSGLDILDTVELDSKSHMKQRRILQTLNNSPGYVQKGAVLVLFPGR